MEEKQPYNPVVNMEVLRHLRQNMMGQNGLGAETPQGGQVLKIEHPQPQIIKHSLSDIKHTKKGL